MDFVREGRKRYIRLITKTTKHINFGLEIRKCNIRIRRRKGTCILARQTKWRRGGDGRISSTSITSNRRIGFVDIVERRWHVRRGARSTRGIGSDIKSRVLNTICEIRVIRHKRYQVGVKESAMKLAWNGDVLAAT